MPRNGIYTYIMDRYLIYGLNVGAVLKVKGPTVIPSLLYVDGGGVRGVAILTLMKRL